MFRAVLTALGLLFVAALASEAPAQQVGTPRLSARVTDQTGTLKAEEVASLERSLAELEAAKGAQVAILIVTTTGGEAIESFALRVVEQSKLGRAKVDDGVLILIAKQDRAVRIEVGYGLEGVVSDVIAKRIIDSQITPYFKAGDFYQGVKAGVDSVAALIRGENLPAPPQRLINAYGSTSGGPKRFDVLFVLAFILIGIGSALKRTVGDFGGSLIAGLGCGALGFFMFGVGLAVLLGAIGFFLTLFGAFQGRGIGGGYSGGFGGGGWSGGGGSFGGGGASGRW